MVETIIYESWKFEVTAELEYKGLCDIVSGRSWSEKPCARIIHLVDKMNYVHIQTQKTAKQFRDKLKSTLKMQAKMDMLLMGLTDSCTGSDRP